MDSLTLRNFRCFFAIDSAPIRPLTLLVGENSTGKSSFLAGLRLAWDTAYNQGKRIDFNEEPFLLGAYDQIAHYRGGRAGRAVSFSIGFEARSRRHRANEKIPSTIRYNTVFRQDGSHATIEGQSVEIGKFKLGVSFDLQTNKPTLTFTVDGEELELSQKDFGVPYRFTNDSPMDWMYVSYLIARNELLEKKLVELGRSTDPEFQLAAELRKDLGIGPRRRPIAIAPVRSRPQRTYNPISEAPLPEGEHVPMVLAKTYFSDKVRWQALSDSLDKFGAESGLYTNIAIKGLGSSESDPFQLRVKIEGPPANLVDVGYGVSQVLPILVDALVADRGDQFLLQQPEVHLHPRAQAALGTFLARLAGKQGKRFVIETHSDYLIDRVRTVIRDGGVIKAEDVSVLFFDRHGVEVVVHALTIDEKGNLRNAPSSYRQFFLAEEGRFLGLS